MKWPKVKIDSIKADGNYSLVGGPFGSNLITRDYVDEGIPVIRGNNLSDDRLFDETDFVFVTEEKANQLQSNNSYPGDLIFTQRGTLGQVGIIPRDSHFQRYVISQSQMKLTVNLKKAHPRFVYYFFRQPTTIQEIKNRASSSGVPHINLRVLKDFEIPLPSLEVQHTIASILSTYDDLIENNLRRIKLLEESARLLYKEWFVRLRFPGYEHTRIKNGIPEGWEKSKLGTLALINGVTLPSSFEGWIKYIDISSVTPASINQTTEYDFKDAPSRARRAVNHGDIIWSCVRPNRRSHAIIWKPVENLVVSTGFAVLSPTIVPTSFLYHATTRDEFVGHLENRARGAAYPAVVAKDFEEADVVVPTGNLLSIFDDTVHPMIDQAHNLKIQNDKLRQARDILLPKLMNGEVEV